MLSEAFTENSPAINRPTVANVWIIELATSIFWPYLEAFECLLCQILDGPLRYTAAENIWS